MNIYALEGHKVKVTEESAKAGHNSDIEKVAEHLEIGKEYTVEYTIVHGWSSEVKLKEVDGVHFNTVNFVDVEEQSEEDDEEHPQYDEYN